MLQKVICASINLQHISSQFHYSRCSFITPEYILYFFKQSFFISSIHFFKIIQMNTNINELSWNSCFEWHKRLSVWKFDSLKRDFSLMHDDFCEPDWLIQRTASSNVQQSLTLYFSPLFFFFLIGLLLLCWGFLFVFF